MSKYNEQLNKAQVNYLKDLIKEMSDDVRFIKKKKASSLNDKNKADISAKLNLLYNITYASHALGKNPVDAKFYYRVERELNSLEDVVL